MAVVYFLIKITGYKKMKFYKAVLTKLFLTVAIIIPAFVSGRLFVATTIKLFTRDPRKALNKKESIEEKCYPKI